MKKLVRFAVVGLMVTGLLVGCAKPPVEDINAAKATVDAVVSEGGEVYAKGELEGLRTKLEAALAEVKTQDEKFFKNYDKAKADLVALKGEAESVKGTIPARKEAAKNEAMAASTAAKTAVEEAKTLLAGAPKGKGSMADLEAMNADVAGLEQALPQVDSMITSEDYFGARDKANAIKDQATGVADQIKQAIEKVQASKKGRKK